MRYEKEDVLLHLSLGYMQRLRNERLKSGEKSRDSFCRDTGRFTMYKLSRYVSHVSLFQTADSLLNHHDLCNTSITTLLPATPLILAKIFAIARLRQRSETPPRKARTSRRVTQQYGVNNSAVARRSLCTCYRHVIRKSARNRQQLHAHRVY